MVKKRGNFLRIRPTIPRTPPGGPGGSSEGPSECVRGLRIGALRLARAGANAGMAVRIWTFQSRVAQMSRQQRVALAVYTAGCVADFSAPEDRPGMDAGVAPSIG